MQSDLVIISNGMPKSASTLLYNYLLGIVEQEFPDNGNALLRKSTDNRNGMFFEHVDENSLRLFEEVAGVKSPVLFKTHFRFEAGFRKILEKENYKILYTVRDPRDVILSGIDSRKHAEAKGEEFARKFTDVIGSVPIAKNFSRRALGWIDSNLALIVRYENLVSRPLEELIRVCTYLKLEVSRDVLGKIVDKELETRQKDQHRFNKGLVSRFRQEMSAKEIAFCNRELEAEIIGLGYSIDS